MLSRLTAHLKRMDWIFITSIVLLTLVGVLFIYSATYQSEDHPLSALSRKQFVWLLVGLLCFMTIALSDYRNLHHLAWPIFGICIVMLVAVLLVGQKIHGASRWLSLFGFQLQPSEFAKLGVVIAVSRFLSEPSKDTSDPRCLMHVLLILALPFILIYEQPDLGTSLTLLPIAFIIMFVAGVPFKYLATFVLVGILIMPLGWFVLDDYQKERILVFFDPGRDPLDSGWNKIQSEIAVGAGGLTGKGYLNGTQNILGFLPRTVAPTDFIFSVIAEETGFLGSAALLVLYSVVVWRGLCAAIVARDKLGRLLAVGVITLLSFHVFVNMAMTVGLLPVTGIPLPLISYGGSFMICTMCGLGLVQSVYARRIQR